MYGKGQMCEKIQYTNKRINNNTVQHLTKHRGISQRSISKMKTINTTQYKSGEVKLVLSSVLIKYVSKLPPLTL